MHFRLATSVTLAGTVAFAFAVSSQTAVAVEWNLATTDTSLTIGLVGQNMPAILALKNPTQQFNWTQQASPIPLLSSAIVNGNSVSMRWQFQGATVDKADGTKLTLKYADTATGLVTTTEWWARPGAGPIHHASFITNKGAGAVTIPYQPTLSLQLATPTAVDAWYFASDGGAPDAQGVYREPVTQTFNRTLRTDPNAANGSIPLAVLDSGGRQGLYVGTEWSYGDIKIAGSPSNPLAASVSSGNVLDHQATLQAGQVFTVPPGFVGTYNGNIDAAGNSLRKYLFKYNTPNILRNDPTYPKVQWNACIATGKTPGSWDSVESRYYPLVDDAKALGFEEVMLDIGWWTGAEPNADPQDWPSGMKAAADYAHQHGMKFGMYWSANRNMANPSDQQVQANQIKRLFNEYGADIWRSDGTSGPPVYSNYAAVKGFYDMLDGLQRDVSGFQWENCNGGGRIKDYGAMKRGMKIFNSDTYSALDVRQAFHDSSYAFLPMQIEGHLVTIHGNSTDGSNRPTGPVEMKYAFRSTSIGAPEWIIDAPNGGNSTPWTAEEKQTVAQCVLTYKNKIRPLVRTADLYHIFARPDDRLWDGIEYYDPTTRKGVVYMFKPNSTEDTRRIVLQGLDIHQIYQLTFEDGSNPSVSMSGADLMNVGIDVTLRGQYVSELMFIQVPEPGPLTLLTGAALALGICKWRRRNSKTVVFTQ